ARGTASTPVAAYAVVTTPALTMSGAAAEMTKNTTDGTPSASLASAAVTTLCRCSVRDIASPGEGVGYRRLSTAPPTAAVVWAISSRYGGGSEAIVARMCPEPGSHSTTFAAPVATTSPRRTLSWVLIGSWYWIARLS